MNGSRLLPAPAAVCLPLALSLALVGFSPGVGHAQYSQSLPVIDGKAWKDALDTLRYARLYQPTINRAASDLTGTERAFQTLVDYTSDERLEAMLMDPSPNLRVFAFFALKERNKGASQKIFNIAYDKLRDESVARSGGGCVVITTPVGDAIMSSMIDELTESQKTRVLDYLLFQPNNLRLTDTALRSWAIPAGYRETLHSLVEHGRPTALIALGHLYDERDIPFIIKHADKHRELAFEVMSEHKRDEFFAYLQSISSEIFADNWPSYKYYPALASYGSERAMPLFQAALAQVDANGRDNHATRVFYAALEAAKDDAGFIPLLWQLWEREQRVDIQSFDLLWAQDQKRAMKQIDKTLRQSDFTHIGGSLLVRMLRLSAGPARTVAPEIWPNVIEHTSYLQNDELADYVGAFRPEAAIEPLFAKLLIKDELYIHVSFARAILAYKRDNLNKRLGELVSKNPHLREGWTGQTMLDVLKEHGVSVPEK